MRSHLGSMVLQSLYPFPWRCIAFHIFLYPISSFSLFQWAPILTFHFSHLISLSIYLYSDIHSLCSFSHQFFSSCFCLHSHSPFHFFLFLFLSQLPHISILMSTISSLYALSGINFLCHLVLCLSLHISIPTSFILSALSPINFCCHLVLYLSLHISIPTSFILFALSPINFSHLISLSIPTLPSIFSHLISMIASYFQVKLEDFSLFFLDSIMIVTMAFLIIIKGFFK